MSHSLELEDKAQVFHKTKYFLVALALFILPISGLAIDIYVPSLPAVSHFFGVGQSLTQLTITAYMVGLGIMQLFSGAISDSYGRRKPFLISMFLFILITLFIPAANNIYTLLLLRFLQGMVIAITVVPMRSVVSDLFEGQQYYKMVSYMTMAWSIGPIVAPAIGGYLQHYFGWQANFYFIAIYCSISLILNAVFLPETSMHRHPFELSSIVSRYKNILSQQTFITSLFTNVFLYSQVILFSIIAPFLIQNVLHYSALVFGRMALLVGLAWFLGSVINRLTFATPILVKNKILFWLILAFALLTFVLQITNTLNIYLIAIPTFTIALLGGISFPNNFARAVALTPTMSGSANALFGGFIFLLTGITSALGTLLKSNSALPLTLAYIALILPCLLINYFDLNRNKL